MGDSTVTKSSVSHATQAVSTTAVAYAQHVYPWQFLTSTGLKWIAVITMLIDHVAAVLVYGYYLKARGTIGGNASELWDVYYAMRAIGRVAFPIFCFVLVEGFVHTRSRTKYALRLLLFAIVSEIPYDLALHGSRIDYTSNLNIMFTLLLAFCALWLAEVIGARSGLSERFTLAYSVVTLALAALLSEQQYLDTSYHQYGILLIGGMYLGRRWRLAQIALGALATWRYCLQAGSTLQGWACAGLLCLLFYNGKRGRGMKYFFYLFYPLHLLVLWWLKLLLL